MLLSALHSGEHSGGLHDVLGASISPLDVLGVALVEDGDFLAIDVEELPVLLDLALELAMGGVILEHVHHVVQGDEGVIDGDHLKRVNNGLTMFALYPATLLYTYT